jgi:hypothetical protein
MVAELHMWPRVVSRTLFKYVANTKSKHMCTHTRTRGEVTPWRSDNRQSGPRPTNKRPCVWGKIVTSAVAAEFAFIQSNHVEATLPYIVQKPPNKATSSGRLALPCFSACVHSLHVTPASGVHILTS